jgi:hypothetical protein
MFTVSVGNTALVEELLDVDTVQGIAEKPFLSYYAMQCILTESCRSLGIPHLDGSRPTEAGLGKSIEPEATSFRPGRCYSTPL